MDKTYRLQALKEWPIPFQFKDIISMKSFKECFAIKGLGKSKASKISVQETEIGSIGLIFGVLLP